MIASFVHIILKRHRYLALPTFLLVKRLDAFPLLYDERVAKCISLRRESSCAATRFGVRGVLVDCTHSKR